MRESGKHIATLNLLKSVPVLDNQDGCHKLTLGKKS